MLTFSIQCATCQATLNVRDEALIGQILACPKCQSMVMVELPEGYQAEDSDDASRAAESGESVPQAAGAAKRGKRSPAPHPHYDSNADTKPMVVPGADELSAKELHVLPTSDWSSTESQKMKRILLLSGLGVGVVIIAVAFGGFWVSSSRPVANADGDDQPTSNTSSDGTGGHDKPDSNSDAPVPSSETNPFEPNGNGGSDEVIVEKGETDTDGTSPNVEPGTTVTDGGAQGTTGNQVGAENKPPTTNAVEKTQGAETQGGGAEPFDPDSGSKPPETDETSEDLTKSLKKLESLLTPGGEDEEPRGESPLTAIKQPIVLAPKPDSRNVDIDVQLRRPIASIEFESVPLVSFIRFVSKMSTIPVSLDPIALKAKGLSSKSIVAVSKQDTTVAEVLESVLAPHGLTLARGKNHLRVELANTQVSRLDVADLLAGDSLQLDHLATWVNALIASKPNSDAARIGELTVEGQTLVVDGHPNVHFRVKRFLDRLRIARGLEGKHEIASDMLQLEFSEQSSTLQKPVSANFRIPAYFTDVLEHIAQSAEVDLLVDWESAAKVGWNADGRIRLGVEDVPLGEALTELLEPMELGYQVVAENTIQIVSARDSSANEQVFFHPAEDVLEILDNDKASLLTLLQATLGASRFRTDGGSIRVFVDSASKRLIAFGSAADHRAILKLLARTRRSK